MLRCSPQNYARSIAEAEEEEEEDEIKNIVIDYDSLDMAVAVVD